MRLFLPTPRQTNFLIVAGFAALGAAIYLRYGVLESTALNAACEAGAMRAGCSLRRMVLELQETQIFGGVALIAALMHLLRPTVAAFTVALVALLFGLLLFNPSTAAFAAGLLIIAFARPVRASTPMPAPAGSPRTTSPASSETSH